MMQEHEEWEITKAWTLWNSLHGYADVLWKKYEKSFSLFLKDPDYQVEGCFEIELEEDDIPF